MNDSREDAIVTATDVTQQPTPPPSDSHAFGSTDTHIAHHPDPKRMEIDEDAAAPDMLSPMSVEGDKQDENELPVLGNSDLGSPSLGYDFSNVRVRFLSIKLDLATANLFDS